MFRLQAQKAENKNLFVGYCGKLTIKNRKNESDHPKDNKTEMVEVEIVVGLNGATEFGAKVNCLGDGREETLIFYDHHEKTLNVDTRTASLGYGRKTIESGSLELKDKLLTLRIFVDRSIVEVFANDK